MQLKHDIDNGLNLNVIDTVLARMAKSLSSHLSISKSSIKQLFLDDFELPLTQYNIHSTNERLKALFDAGVVDTLIVNPTFQGSNRYIIKVPKSTTRFKNTLNEIYVHYLKIESLLKNVSLPITPLSIQTQIHEYTTQLDKLRSNRIRVFDKLFHTLSNQLNVESSLLESMYKEQICVQSYVPARKDDFFKLFESIKPYVDNYSFHIRKSDGDVFHTSDIELIKSTEHIFEFNAVINNIYIDLVDCEFNNIYKKLNL